MKILNRISLAALTICFVLLTDSCKKNDTPNGPNDLGGETNIPLTQVGSVTSVYIKINGVNMPNGEMTVTNNSNGIVKYHMVIDLNGQADSALLAGLTPAEYQDGNGHLVTDLTLKITSEGIQDYSQGDKPWTIVKYEDNVGATYPFTTDKGKNLLRTVTEKTGVDEWPLGFYYIKTSKVEEIDPPSIKEADHIIYRANHKFGLVYAEIHLKDGNTASISLLPWFLM
ncbi:MAG: hypothetical protein U0T74_00085 [Chitinophagales bacterium]